MPSEIEKLEAEINTIKIEIKKLRENIFDANDQIALTNYEINKISQAPLSQEKKNKILQDYSTIDKETSWRPQPSFYLFSYGSNGIFQLTERLGISAKIIKNNVVALRLPGWIRSYFSYSQKWEGAIAYLSRMINENYYVDGIGIKIKKDGYKFTIDDNEIDMMNLSRSESVQTDKYHLFGVPGCYYYDLDKKEYKLSDLPVVFYQGGTPQGNALPSDTYLNAIGKMLKDRRDIMKDESKDQIIFPVYKFYSNKLIKIKDFTS